MTTIRPWRVFVISARRPLNVPTMHQRWFGTTEPVTWVVPEEDAESYAAAGAPHLLPVAAPCVPGTWQLPAQRNAALRAAHAAGHVCVQVDDDLRRLSVPDRDGKRKDVDWATARTTLLNALHEHSAHLAGIAPTSNVLSARRTVSALGFAPAALFATDTAAPQFDERLPLKEDYDYVCQHLVAYGGIARVNWLVADFQQRTNRGGVVTYRTPALERTTAERLLERWPQYLKPHPSRTNELSFKRTSAPGGTA